MKGLIQRVTHASVDVDGRKVARIDGGLLLFLGVEKTDDLAVASRLCQRVLGYRVFQDSAGRMNVSLKDGGGSLLIVPQFTLVADTRSGNRPGFSRAGRPDHAEGLFNAFATEATRLLGPERVATGEFGVDMKVSLMNDGPVTFLLGAD
jgi:D-aminoacyl-tRNA deacylase